MSTGHLRPDRPGVATSDSRQLPGPADGKRVMDQPGVSHLHVRSTVAQCFKFEVRAT
jgi:hypothetical protein